jgi:hypothetical protein
MQLKIEIEHLRMQYGVGQGGFHAAHVLCTEGDKVSCFDYVYDCGALKAARPPKELKRAIRHYTPRKAEGLNRSPLIAERVIDALIISHFDRDHMNGAHELSLRNTIRRVYLPYLSNTDLLIEILVSATDGLDPAFVTELFNAAYAPTMWDAVVTRVGREIGDDRDELPVQPDNDRTPGTMVEVNARTGKPVGKTLNHEDSVNLNAGAATVWCLRFWNYIYDRSLGTAICTKLQAIGFPVGSLSSIDGAEVVSKWLKTETFRDKALEIYRDEILEIHQKTHKGKPLPGIANLISLAVCSAPYAELEIVRGHFFSRGEPMWYWRFPLVGWLGTGDAPLGEPAIWSDFEKHYDGMLHQVSTVLIPHHGAAPHVGPAFYNPSLMTRIGIVNVISVGSTNAYGHPRTSVLAAIARGAGVPQIVSEMMWPGYVEVAGVEALFNVAANAQQIAAVPSIGSAILL